MDRGFTSRPGESLTHSIRCRRPAATRCSSRHHFQIPASLTFRPTAPNCSSEAVPPPRTNARCIPCRSWACHHSTSATFVPPQLGLRMGKTLSLFKGPAFTEPGATVPKHGRSPLLLRVAALTIILVAGPAGHPTEAACDSPCRLKRMARHCGKSRQTDKIPTRCFPDGTTRHRSVVGVGRQTGSISFSSHSGAELRTSGRFAKREASSGRPATNRYS